MVAEHKCDQSQRNNLYGRHVQECLRTGVAPTDVPKRITTIYIRALDAVSVSCFTTAALLNRLPSMSIPTRGAVDGRIRQTTMVDNDGEEYLLQLRYGAKLLHTDLALLICGQQLHKGRLDNRHQCHIGVGRHRNRAHNRCLPQLTAKEQGGRSVRTADNRDCRCLSSCKSQ